MKRDIDTWANQSFDIVIIGGGINGSAVAWEAALRGYSVALVERGDFGWATSSNSAKIAHCGMRYLQHADLNRMKTSIRERINLVQNAPQLVDSLPFIMPVYGHGIKGKEAVATYLKVYDLLSRQKAQLSDPDRRVKNSGMLPPDDVLAIMPGISMEGLTGAGIWQEGQMHNTERLLLAYLKSANSQGAKIANYADVTEITHENNRVTGVKIDDLHGGNSITVRAELVINATGPWAVHSLLSEELRHSSTYGIHASKAFSLLTKSFTNSVAFTFPIKPMYADKKALIDKGCSMQFAIPWRDSTMVASLHLACETDNPDNISITAEEISMYIELINEGYPKANLSHADIKNILWGIIPAEEKGSAAPLKHHKIIDHQKTDDLSGLLTIVGVKYTTARDVAEETIAIAEKSLELRKTASTSAERPLFGGDIARISEFQNEALIEYSPKVQNETVIRLTRTYGTEISAIMKLVEEHHELGEQIADTGILRAEVIYAMRYESALTLADVILRRTQMGSLERPSDIALEDTASLMANELHWSDAVKEKMISNIQDFYSERYRFLGLAKLSESGESPQ